MKKYSILIFTFMLAACSGDSGGSGDDSPNAPTRSSCNGAKCDTTGVPALTSLPSEFGSCTVIPDIEAADIFFSRDQWNCEFFGFEPDSPVELQRIFAFHRRGDGRLGSTTTFTADEIADSTEKLSGIWPGESYPLSTNVTVVTRIQTSKFGRLGSDDVGTSFLTQEIEKSVASRPEGEIEQIFGLDIEFWPVVLWPTTEFAEAWSNEEIDFFVASLRGDVVFDDSSISYRYGRYGVRGDEDLKDLPRQTFVVPAQPDRALPTLDMELESNEVTHSMEIDGPGYYLINADGSLRKAEPAEVLEFGMSREDQAAPPEGGRDVGGTDAGMDSGQDAGIDASVVDPCNGECASGEVCVEDACVARSEQTQRTSCDSPQATCDIGEDGDCAEGHACVEGLCRRLTCQEQSSCSTTARAVCEDDGDCAAENACAGGVCRLISCQTQDQFCNTPRAVCEEDTDCAENHACADGTCRRLICQTQDTFCNTPNAVCEEDTDCAEGHACAEGLCRRLTCQTQDQFCSEPRAVCEDNSDCAGEHACVEGNCRRLTCQTQDQFCNAPRAVCEVDADCGADHVCAEGICRRLTCQAQDQFCNSTSSVCEDATDCADGHVCDEGSCTRISCL